jgi:hypothetical protein
MRMFISSNGIGRRIGGALALLVAATIPSLAWGAPVEPPVAGQQMRFAKGFWSALPQVGPDGKVRQCVLVALRQRAGKDGPVDTRFAINISRGAGLVVTMHDDGLPAEQVLDDQAELVIGDRTFPAVGFPVGTAFAFHPGDAAGALTAIGKATRVRLRSDGAGIDSGAVTIDLPAEALNWLKQCGKTFDIAIDRPSDPDAPELPSPLPRSPKTALLPVTTAGPPGMADKQRIEGWDASELRNNDGNIIVCYIRRRYVTGSEPGSRRLGTFLMVSRRKGFTVMLKDSNVKLSEGQPVEATLDVGSERFIGFSAQVLGEDEIGIFPQHGNALAAALEKGVRATFKSKVSDNFEFPVQASVVPWLRACARRNGIAMEPAT